MRPPLEESPCSSEPERLRLGTRDRAICSDPRAGCWARRGRAQWAARNQYGNTTPEPQPSPQTELPYAPVKANKSTNAPVKRDDSNQKSISTFQPDVDCPDPPKVGYDLQPSASPAGPLRI